MARFEEWLEVLANKETSSELSYDGGKACLDMGFSFPDELLDLVEKDPKEATNRILKYVISERTRVSSATLDNRINAVKQFLGYYDLRGKVSWGKIKVAKPKRKKVASDRAPTKEEIRALLQECDSRMRFFVLTSASCGARRGWIDYASVKDLSPVKKTVDNVEITFGRLVVYYGEPEEYVTFITPEAWESWLQYREDRERVGEWITNDSPLIRDAWVHRFHLKSKFEPEKAERVGSKTLGNNLLELWQKAKILDKSSSSGYRLVRSSNNGKLGEFKTVHGFRKFFETQCGAARLSSSNISVLKGTQFSYHKPQEQYLIEEYCKAIPFLTMSKTEEVRRNFKSELSEEKELSRELAARLNVLEQSVKALKKDFTS